MVGRLKYESMGLVCALLLGGQACASPTPGGSDVALDIVDAHVPDIPEEVSCTPPTALDLDQLTPSLPAVPAAAGVDAYERPAYQRLVDLATSDADVLFVGTYAQDDGVYRLVGGSVDGPKVLEFRRKNGPEGTLLFEIVQGGLGDFFPATDPLLYPDLTDLQGAMENPNDAMWPDLGYTSDDPRMGFLRAETTAYPLALERIAALFDAETAPDAMVEFQPYAKSGPGTHGGLDLLQSRASLVLGGAGVREGQILDEVATLADIAPTVLAALGADTVGGSSQLGEFKGGLYLRRQDGRPLIEALDTETCGAAAHAVIVTFDGLMASEFNHQILAQAPDVALPHLRELAQGGVVFRGGAVSPWPSFSAPGHMTIGTGVWSGHHGIVNNVFYDRSSSSPVDFFGFISDPVQLLNDSELFAKTYEEFVDPEVETLAQAAHRAFGPFSDDGGAFVVVLNDFAIRGADRTSFDLIAPTSGTFNAKFDLAELADDFALNQALDILGDSSLPVPTVMMLSFYTTDKAGEGSGPHSDDLRLVLAQMDARIGELRGAYEARGAGQDTLWLFVSDHGMSLQDPTRQEAFSAALDASGLKLHQPMRGMFYLRTMELKVILDGLAATATVLNHDTGEPVEGVEIRCQACTPSLGTTGPQGQLTLKAPAGALIEFEATHEDFNPQEATVATPWTR